ncbi:MAG TPA: substrate-binding domain-containing protein [Candidatus Limnocylindrales bacterium]|jgi:ABC-type xylose transport system substrate-binding protein
MSLGFGRIAALGLTATLLAVGCSSPLTTTPVDDHGPTGIVALLLPDKQAARYEAADVPFFEAEFSKACPNATVDAQNAEGNPAMQQFQVEAELAKGARVLVLDATDGSTMGSVVGDATARAIHVISYDRLLTAPGSKPDAYVGYDAGLAAAIDPGAAPVPGQDRELAAIERIIAGSQSMTVYEPVQPEAIRAADLACAALGAKVTPAPATTNNGTADVPSFLLAPITVTIDGSAPGTVSIEASVVKDLFFGPDTVALLCPAALAARCAAAGIK